MCTEKPAPQREIQITDDGSATLYLPQLDEHYHSVKGAITESRHIYRDCGYLFRASQSPGPVTILEIGLGTGMNAAVTAMAANDLSPVRYIALELYPLSLEEVDSMQLDRFVDPRLLRDLHQCPWDGPRQLTPAFTLEKRRCDFTQCDLPSGIDVVYFDAFAPEKQPEMWSPELFRRIFHAMNPGGVLTTYCAKGCIRRMLSAIGFSVERLPGPPGGKREIIRAIRRINPI